MPGWLVADVARRREFAAARPAGKSLSNQGNYAARNLLWSAMSDSWQPGSIDAQMLKALKKHRRRILAGSGLVIGVLLLAFLGWSFYLDRIVTSSSKADAGRFRRRSMPSHSSSTPASRSAPTRWSRNCAASVTHASTLRKSQAATDAAAGRIDFVSRRFRFWDAMQESQALIGHGERNRDRRACAMRTARMCRSSGSTRSSSAAFFRFMAKTASSSRLMKCPSCCLQRSRWSKIASSTRITASNLSAITARDVGQLTRRANRTGRLDAHPTAREELFPGQSPHLRPQDRRSDDGHAAGSALRASRT